MASTGQYFDCASLTLAQGGVQYTTAEYNLIYNILSFAIATMGAATTFFFFQFSLVEKRFRTALIITALVVFIAFYHYIRIYNSFTESYMLMGYMNKAGAFEQGVLCSGIPFNDAYRYVDWLLTVPLLLTELILIMGLPARETRDKCLKLGSSAALMIVLGYPGEVADTSSGFTIRWLFWVAAMVPFIYIVYTLFYGLRDAVEKQGDAKSLVRLSCWITVISWCTYPVVYLFPMMGLTGAAANVAIQVGYSIADIIAKPILGLLVWRIAVVKASTTHDQLRDQE